jgi:hypothetical protein
MNSSKFIQAVLFMSLLALAASCGSARRYPQYPNYPPPPPEYPRQQGPVVIVNDPHDLPPGQAKKIYGQQSARDFAHCKRHGNRYCDRHYQPAIVITFPDRRASRDRYGRLFHLTADGLYYWRGNDGRYYLDNDRFQQSFGNCDRDRDDDRYDRRGRGRGKGRDKHRDRDDD